MHRVVTVALAVLSVAVSVAQAAPPKKLAVIAIEPGADVAAAGRAATAAGYAPVVVAVPAVDDAVALAEVERALDQAHAAWLAQQYGEMVALLDRVESEALPLLARPEHTGALWQLVFLRGLMRVSRGAEGDAAAAERWFVLALELAPARRPERGTYPPAVDGAFALAAEELGRRVARGVALRVVPADARVVVDQVPMVDRARPRLLRRGVHVVLAEAPGHRPWARLVEIDDAPVEVALEPIAGLSPAEALAPLAARGLVDLDGDTARRLVGAAALGVGAERALVVSARGARLWRAGIIDPWRPDAIAALADAEPRPIAGPPPPPPRRRWWLWGGAGLAVAAAVVTTLLLVSGDAPADRTQLGFEP